MIAIKVECMKHMPSDCDFCYWFGTRPHPYKGWTDICELTAHCMDDDQPEEWIYSGDGRPKACPLVEVADRKTENCSEFPNNSTRSKMEQVETMSCAECKHRPIGAEICEEPCHYEPQTDWHYDEQDATWYPYKHEDEPQTNADQHVQHVGSVESVEPTWTKEEHEAFYTFLWNVINPNEMQDYIEMFETKDEPQTERSE